MKNTIVSSLTRVFVVLCGRASAQSPMSCKLAGTLAPGGAKKVYTAKANLRCPTDAKARQVGSIRNTVIVVVLLLIVIAFAPGYYNVYQEELHIQLIADNMLSLPDSARTAINGHVARTGSLIGSGKGVAVAPNKMSAPRQELEWNVSDDGHILGRNTTFLKVNVEWIPAVQNSRVVWSCKVTFPGPHSKLTPPHCPETV